MPDSAHRVTIKNVASRAGVSIGAASRILRHDPSCRVGDATRRRVLATARELGYAPNPIAQALKSGKTRLIGILSGGTFHTPVRQRKLDAIVRRIVNAEYQVMVESYDHRPQGLEALLRELLRMRSCAILVAFGNGPWGETLPPDVYEELAQVRRSGTPVVGMDAEVPGDWVMVDRRAGVYRGAQHLLDLGHRRIAFLGATPAGTHSDARMRGYRQALEDAGVTPDPELVVPRAAHTAPTACHWGQVAAADLLARRPDVTALIAEDDRVAMGAVRAALCAGRRIPEQLSVIGFDGDPEAEFAAVPITTLAQPVDEMGEITVRFLLEALQRLEERGSLPEPQQIRLEPRLTERESCGPPLAVPIPAIPDRPMHSSEHQGG